MHTCPKHSYYATEPAQNEPQAQEGDILLENKIQLFILVKTSQYFDLQPPLLFPPQKQTTDCPRNNERITMNHA